MFIDILVAIALVFATVKGIRNGLIIAVFSILAFIIGLAAALKLSTVVASWLAQSTNINVQWLPFLASGRCRENARAGPTATTS